MKTRLGARKYEIIGVAVSICLNELCDALILQPIKREEIPALVGKHLASLPTGNDQSDIRS